MNLIVGASGALGSIVCRRLLERGEAVRAMSRAPETRLSALKVQGAEVVQGDLRDKASLQRACAGVTKVVSSAHALFNRGDERSELVDLKGQQNLVDAAKAAGVELFVMVSIRGADLKSPIAFLRFKAGAEQYLRNSGLAYTILQPNSFMGFHTYQMIGRAIVESGQVRLFGKGESLRNYVADENVADFVLMALEDPDLRGQTIEIGGPDNLTPLQVVALYERLSGRQAKVSHVPRAALRVMSLVLRPFHPGLSQVMALGLHGDIHGDAFDPGPLQERYPLQLISLEDYARSRLAEEPGKA
jgi:NADH dehydrogenase